MSMYWIQGMVILCAPLPLFLAPEIRQKVVGVGSFFHDESKKNNFLAVAVDFSLVELPPLQRVVVG